MDSLASILVCVEGLKHCTALELCMLAMILGLEYVVASSVRGRCSMTNGDDVIELSKFVARYHRI